MMASEPENPYRSPVPIEQSNGSIQAEPLLPALRRAVILGCWGMGPFAGIYLIALLSSGDFTWDDVIGGVVLSLQVGLVFASSEILRIGTNQTADDTTKRILGSIGLMAACIVGVTLGAAMFWPDILLADASWGVYSMPWMLVVSVVVCYYLSLWSCRQVMKSRYQSSLEYLPTGGDDGE